MLKLRSFMNFMQGVKYKIMPMQIGLDELLSMLVSRVEEMNLENENQKSKFNIMFRILYKKGIFNDNDVFNAILDENKILLELGAIKEMPDENLIRAAAENLLLWIKGDPKEIKNSVEDMRKKLQEAAEKQNRPKIDVAPAEVLNELDRLGASNKSKLIL